MDALADESGVHRTTLYRHWRSVDALVADAIADRAHDQIPVTNTGSLGADLTDLARAIVREVNSPIGRALLRFALDDGPADPHVDAMRQRFFRDRRRLLTPIIDDAVHRGDAPAGTDPVAVAQSLSAPLLVAALITGDVVDDGDADRAVAVVIAAISAGAFVSHGRAALTEKDRQRADGASRVSP